MKLAKYKETFGKLFLPSCWGHQAKECGLFLTLSSSASYFRPSSREIKPLYSTLLCRALSPFYWPGNIHFSFRFISLALEIENHFCQLLLKTIERFFDRDFLPRFLLFQKDSLYLNPESFRQ